MFNQSVKHLQRVRAALHPLSKKTDYLKDEVAARVVDRLYDITRTFDKVLDYGSGTGHIARQVEQGMMKELVMTDPCKEMLFRDDETLAVPTKKHMGSFKEGEFDAVLSSCALHWENDLEGALKKIQKILKPDGVFIGAVFGNDTLYELRTSLQLAETERFGGVSPHISPMLQSKDVSGLLSACGFTLTTVDVDEIVVEYPSMYELMEDLQIMGESNALLNRKPTVHKDLFFAAGAIYDAVYGKQGRIPATFSINYMIGWKPHESQPKPIARGSGKTSLKTAL